MNFLKTKREETREDIFGIKVADPYRWLEDVKNPEVKEWIDAQNTHTDNTLRNETFETFSRELVKNFKVTTFSNPVPIKGRYFYYERQPDEDQDAFYMKIGIDGEPIKLVDPNGMNYGNTVSLDFCFPSRTGKYLAYGLSQRGGDEMPTIHIKDTGTNKDLGYKIPRCKTANVRWLPDDSGFFYKRNHAVGDVPQNEEHLHTKVYFHKLGDDPMPDDYAVKQEWYTSKDSTRVPMFIFHRKDIAHDVAHPTILYGYGGFGRVESPNFKRGFVPWIERGGIFAVVNIRGGGEFGEVWHNRATKEKKQNSFDDFISAGEYLVEQGYTSAEHLGIFGGSNGGLLVSAVAVQRPDLFKAVCSRVPLTDMARFPKFGMALRWVHEYGNPENEVDLKNILKWSPYHNVKEGTEYPAFLFTTAEKDARVDPLHARKMAAILQSVNKKNEIFLFTEKEAGHGKGKPIKKIVESQALTLAFFVKKLGLRI
ncbi:MAG: prolyl oligopeptidase family serine peptidase [Candidatus Yonathbacteria bacterium]|nr:prolyl oligopeptidase family serine peptidase [Candidatus Yonathbacteria bacterium]